MAQGAERRASPQGGQRPNRPPGEERQRRSQPQSQPHPQGESRPRTRRKRRRTNPLPLIILVAALIVLIASLVSSISLSGKNKELQKKVEEDEAAVETMKAELSDAQKDLEDARTPGKYFDPDGPEYQQLYPDFYAPQPLDASQEKEGVIYLTFDDGPSERTDEVLAFLKQEGIHATFFVVGQSSESNLQRMRDIVDGGHTLAMHSFSHDYPKIYASVEAYLDDMYQIFTQIRDTTGVAPTFFRFPGGSINSYNSGIYMDLISEMLRRGFVPCDWNMSTQDATSKPTPAETLVANVMQNANQTRGVVLMHDSSKRQTTVECLPELVKQLKEHGYTSFEALTPEVKPTMFSYRGVS